MDWCLLTYLRVLIEKLPSNLKHLSTQILLSLLKAQQLFLLPLPDSLQSLTNTAKDNGRWPRQATCPHGSGPLGHDGGPREGVMVCRKCNILGYCLSLFLQVTWR